MAATTRLTKTQKIDRGSERHLLCFIRPISDIIAGISDDMNPTRPTLIESLSRCQNENEITPVFESQRWIREIEGHLGLLKIALEKAKLEIKFIRSQRKQD